MYLVSMNRKVKGKKSISLKKEKKRKEKKGKKTGFD